MGYSFDGPNKIIQLTSGTVAFDVDDLYSRWIDWWLSSDNSKYLQAMRAVGGDPLPGSKALGLTFFLMNDWKIRPDEVNHTLNVNGNLYCEDGSSPYVSTVGAYNIMVISAVSSLVDSTVQQLPEIEHGMFQNVVTLNVLAGQAGTTYPIGTPQYPVNNLADAKSIAITRGFDTIKIIDGLTVGATDVISDYTLIGTGPESTAIALTSGCVTSGTTFRDLSILGRQSGETHYYNCDIGDLSNVHCIFNGCRLIGPMAMHQTYADTTVLYNCYTGDIAGATFVLDMNNSPTHMSFNNFSGKMQINNLNKATAGIITINGTGKVILDSTCTTGTVKVRGNIEVVDNSAGTTVDNDTAQALIWQQPIEGTYTAEQVLRLMASVLMGNATGLEGASQAFKDITNSKTRVSGTYAAGTRVTTLDAA